MAIPKSLISAKADEREYLVSLIDNNPIAGLDSQTYAKILETIFVLQNLEIVDLYSFKLAKSNIEFESVNFRADLVTKISEYATTSAVSQSLSTSYQAGLRTLKYIRRLGRNLILIDIDKSYFDVDHISFSIDGTEILLDDDSSVWGDGSSFIMFKVNGLVYISNETTLGNISGVRRNS